MLLGSLQSPSFLPLLFPFACLPSNTMRLGLLFFVFSLTHLASNAFDLEVIDKEAKSDNPKDEKYTKELAEDPTAIQGTSKFAGPKLL